MNRYKATIKITKNLLMGIGWGILILEKIELDGRFLFSYIVLSALVVIDDITR